jgi:hypothetical protein
MATKLETSQRIFLYKIMGDSHFSETMLLKSEVDVIETVLAYDEYTEEQKYDLNNIKKVWINYLRNRKDFLTYY